MRELNTKEIKAINGGVWAVFATAFVKGWNAGSGWVNGGAASFGSWSYNNGNFRGSQKL
ncbi:hypothetical protein [Thalassomonas sp. RHCl1]|uniref:hypothetical protein n=1 Tax=Thalassomonas sp. RHCl1 TaxID=2995320 RepID=UPI00248AA952|nr:hypothetical protein [Thalassomonas sp. RHCl1]